jgi:oligopeptide transport system ATP-binding protein
MTIHEFQPAMAARAGSEQLLTVKDLRVTFGTHDGDVTAVNDLNFSLRAGHCR